MEPKGPVGYWFDLIVGAVITGATATLMSVIGIATENKWPSDVQWLLFGAQGALMGLGYIKTKRDEPPRRRYVPPKFKG